MRCPHLLCFGDFLPLCTSEEQQHIYTQPLQDPLLLQGKGNQERSPKGQMRCSDWIKFLRAGWKRERKLSEALHVCICVISISYLHRPF